MDKRYLNRKAVDLEQHIERVSGQIGKSDVVLLRTQRGVYGERRIVRNRFGVDANRDVFGDGDDLDELED